MTSAYPGGLDALATNKTDGTVSAGDHAAHHNDMADAINKIEPTVGVFFTPEAHGAKGDGQVVADLATTAASAVVTSASGKFTAADVGKAFLVLEPAGGSGVQLSTTVLSYQSATQVTLSAAVSTTLTGAYAVWGTDDTAAINAAVSAATTYALAHAFWAAVLFSDKIYCVAGAPQHGAPTYGNAQIPLPVQAGSAQKLTLAFLGLSRSASTFYHWDSTIPMPSGTVLACMRTDGTNDATYGATAVIGGPNILQGYGPGTVGNVWDNLNFIVEGIRIAVPFNTTYSGFDLYSVAACEIRDAGVLAMDVPSKLATAYNAGLTNFFAAGLIMPGPNNNAHSFVGRYVAEGLAIAMIPGEHMVCESFDAIYCWIAWRTRSWGALPVHAAIVLHANIEQTIWVLDPDTTNGGGTLQFSVEQCTTELTGGLAYDANGYVTGYIRLYGNQSNSNWTGGTNGHPYWQAFDMTAHRGVQTAPGVPASGTGLVNPFLGLMAVNVHGGTVTDIQLAPYLGGTKTSLGFTSGTVLVPPNVEITLVYSVAPSWSWVLL